MHNVGILFSFVLVGVVSSASIGGLFTKCQKSSPNFGDCLIQNAIAGVSKVAKTGNSNLKVNSLTPVIIDRIELQATPSLNVLLNNCTMHGFESIQFDVIEFSDTGIKINTHMDRMMYISQYDIKGQLLVLPIQGIGKGNFTLENSKQRYRAKLQIVEKNGQKHYKITDDKLDLEPERVYFQLDNLFNGDERLGKEMNKFLNDGWREVFEEVKGALSDIMKTVFTTYIQAYFDAVPIQDLIE